MKLKYELIAREVAGEHIMIPVGEAAYKIGGYVFANPVGAFIVEQLKTEQTEETLLDRICDEFDVERSTAETDLKDFLSKLRELKLLDE